MMSLLPPHSREDAYRSLPGTPYLERGGGSVLTPRDMEEAMQHVRMGVEGAGDYFSGVTPRYAMSGGRSGGMRERSPYGVLDSVEGGGGGYPGGPAGGLQEVGLGLMDLVRRTNLGVQLANNNLRSRDQYSQIHPKMCPNGRYPPDFQLPKTVEEFKTFESSQLERILQSYMLPLDLRSSNLMKSSHNHHHHHLLRDPPSSARQARIMTLLQYLGAERVLEHERLKQRGIYG